MGCEEEQWRREATAALLLHHLLFPLRLTLEQLALSFPSKFFSFKVIPKEEWCQIAAFQSEFPAGPEPGEAPEPWL